jgi:chlorite dismutase
MSDGRTLSLFATFRYTPETWSETAPARDALLAWQDELGEVATVHRYRLYPTRGEADFLLWCAIEADDEAAPGRLFHSFGEATERVRRYVDPGSTLWGLTRPSPYARRGSGRAIDPLQPQRLPYLVVYPFVKTTGWYLKSAEERQEMMNGHIRVGRQYPDVQQMLLYSFGLQDQEFVVVYETESLARFSDLVRELRETEARGYTERDTPLWMGLHAPDQEIGLET